MKVVVAVISMLLVVSTGCSGDKMRTGAMQDRLLKRKIELQIRSKYDVPANVDVVLGKRVPGEVPGYDALSVRFSHGGKQVEFPFLLSKDGKRLARLEQVDLTEGPSMAADGVPVRGNPEAKVAIIYFDDLACPFCASMHRSLMVDTAQRYQGLIRISRKDFPLTQIHPWAMHAAVNARCLAGGNGESFWNYIDYIHSHVDDVDKAKELGRSFEILDEMAFQQGAKMKVDARSLRECVLRQDDSAIQATISEGNKLGIESTPTVFVNGERIVGQHPKMWIWAAIDRALEAEGIEVPPSPFVASDEANGKTKK